MYISRFILTFLLLCVAGTNVHARSVWALVGTTSGSQSIVSFDDATPATTSTPQAITGAGSSAIVGIDLRPATGMIYAITSAPGLYTLDPTTGVATQVTVDLATNCSGISGGSSVRYVVDWNPAADALRVLLSTGQNYRIGGFATGALACFQDGTINDNQGRTVSVSTGTYSSNFRGATAAQTTLFVLANVDSSGSLELGRIASPNNGTYYTNGAPSTDITVSSSTRVSIDSYFKYDGNGDTFLVVVGTTLYTAVFSATGAALTSIGTISQSNIISITAALAATTPFPFQAVTLVNNNLNFFLISNPTVNTPVPIGVTGQEFIGIAVRPATYYIIGVTESGRIYNIYPNAALSSVTAYFQAQMTCALAPSANNLYSIDFNPFADLLRIVSSTGENYRVNVTSGVCTVDGSLFYQSDSTVVPAVGVSYTNSLNTPPATSADTAEYVLTQVAGALSLVRVNVPNGGNSTTVGALGVSRPTGSFNVPLDIFRLGSVDYAYAALGKDIYNVNLNTGAATFVGSFSSSTSLDVNGFIAFPSNWGVPSTVPTANADPLPSDAFNVGLLRATSAGVLSYLTFNSQTPSTTTTKTVSPPTGVTLLAIALRPFNNYIYALGSDSNLYFFYPSTNDVTLVFASRLNCTIAPSATNIYSMDFNPVADRLRVVTSTGTNLRINVDDGTCLVDGNLFYTSDGTTPTAIGVSYTPGTTMEYIIDGATSGTRFARVTNPNGGNSTLLGALGATLTPIAPLDILSVNNVSYAYTVDSTRLHRVNIESGAVALAAAYATSASAVQPIGIVAFPVGYTQPATAPAAGTTTQAPGATTTIAPGITTGNSNTNSAAATVLSLLCVAVVLFAMF